MMSPRTTWTVVAVAGASFASALALRAVDLGQAPWALSRAAGLGAFATISLSVILGLSISTKAADGFLKRAFVFEMHQFLSVVSLVLIAVHGGSLLFDGFLRFTPQSILVPFIGPYRPFAVGVGVIAGWLAAITTASFWARARIGQKRWRTLHYATFLAYGGGLWHGLAAGTDTHLAPVYWMYLLSAASVSALLALRIAGKGSRRSPARHAAAVAGAGARRPIVKAS